MNEENILKVMLFALLALTVWVSIEVFRAWPLWLAGGFMAMHCAIVWQIAKIIGFLLGMTPRRMVETFRREHPGCD